MSKDIEEKLAPSDFVRAVILELVERGKPEFPIKKTEWHRAFYDAIQKYKNYKNELPSFDVLVRTAPYIHDVEEGIHELLLAGHLSHVMNVRGDTYRVEKIEEMKESEKEFSMSQRGFLNEVARYVCDRINSK